MKLSIDAKQNIIFVQKDDSDIRMGKESTFFYHLAKKLSSVNFQSEKHFIRKEMVKDGHWVDKDVFYATTPKRNVRVYDSKYAIRNAAKVFNSGEILDLRYEVLQTEEH